jgi:hypothetical protein
MATNVALNLILFGVPLPSSEDDSPPPEPADPESGNNLTFDFQDSWNLVLL